MHGTITGQRYVDDILRPHVRPFPNGLPGAIFQQVNAHTHTARVAQDFLRHFHTHPWPASSPYLSPVEDVWDPLKRQMPSCHSVHDLELAVEDLWTYLPQENIRCLINSMRTVWRHVLQLELVQRAIEVAQYLCRCTPCIRLIVLFLRSSESLNCVIMCIKFHFNPMLSSWVASFNVPECILIFISYSEVRKRLYPNLVKDEIKKSSTSNAKAIRSLSKFLTLLVFCGGLAGRNQPWKKYAGPKINMLCPSLKVEGMKAARA
ncbi:DDE_3 domain-containing protein [Trichonephila clavipes]|nr:DDE_3 domain-containing protein [Trichonephila clavipes]